MLLGRELELELGRLVLGDGDLAGLLAEALVPHRRGYDFNQALMDFGATWCVPRKPKCSRCPMKSFCASYPILG